MEPHERPRTASGEPTTTERANAVLRLLRGEAADTVSQDLGVPPAELERWRKSFLDGGVGALQPATPDTPAVRDSSLDIPTVDLTVRLVRVDEYGSDMSTHQLPYRESVIGRDGAHIMFPDDPYMSPRHAELRIRQRRLYLRDLGSRNGTWFFIERPYRLRDGDVALVGSQILQYRRLGYPGPHPPEADATRRLGSLTPSADIASITQLRSDGSPRDVLHLSPGRNVTIGRDQGDWIFGYDPSMSGLHAHIRSEDADFTIMDAGSRNGIAVAVRGEVELSHGSRFLVGDKMLRVEMA